MTDGRFDVLVVQLARLGDLLQAWPLISGALERHGPGAVGLVVDEQLRRTAELMVGRDNVVNVPVRKWLKHGQNGGISGLWRDVNGFALHHKHLSARTVVNLNYHPPAAMLAQLIPAKLRLGILLDDLLAGEAPSGVLGQFFHDNAGVRFGHRHISDVWCDAAGLRPTKPRSLPLPDSALTSAEHLLRELNAPQLGVAAIVVGSGHTSRRWGAARFRRLVRGMCEHCSVVLLGTPAEAPLAEEILRGLEDLQAEARVVSLCGRAEIEVTAAVTARCRLAVGVDTGGLHIAAAVGTPCLGIYFGSMHYSETGPYGAGHFVLTPNDPDYPCHEREMESSRRDLGAGIPVADAVTAANAILRGREFRTPEVNCLRSMMGHRGQFWVSASGGRASNAEFSKLQVPKVLVANG